MTQLSPDVKKLMSQARDGFSPSEERVDAVRHALAARLASSGGNGGGSPAGGPASGIWGTGTWLGIGALALITAGGIALNSGAFTRDAGDTTVSIPIAVSETVEPVVSPPIENSAKAQAEVSPAPLMAARPAAPTDGAGAVRSRTPRARPAQRQPLSAAASDTRTAARRPSSALQVAAHKGPGELHAAAAAEAAAEHSTLSARGGAAPDATATAPAESPGGAASPVAGRDPAGAPVANTRDTRDRRGDPVVVDESLAREIALLRRVSKALAAGQPATALRLADEHAALFPRGVLRQERLASRALALCALGRAADARTATQELEDVAPRSPHLMRIRASCPRTDGP